MNKLNKIYIFLFIALLIAHIALVWLLPYFPSQDGPSHIYNLVILHDLVNGGKEWGKYFTYDLHLIPNFGFTFLAYPMLHFFSPLVAEKLFISIYMILMGVSTPFFLRTFNKLIFPFAFFVFPVLFNFTLLKGFYSFAVSIPILFISISICWKIYHLHGIYKFVLYNIIGFILFYFHIIPFILFFMTLIVVHFLRSTESKRKTFDHIKFVATVSPIALNLFLYILNNTKSTFAETDHLPPFFHYIQLVIELFFFSTVNFYKWQTIPVFPVIFLTVLFTYSSFKNIYKRKNQGEHILDSEKILLLLTSILVIIYLFAPFRFGGGSLFNERFPWIILIVLLPLFHIPATAFWKRFAPIVIVCAISFNFASNAIGLQQQSSNVKKYMGGLNVSIPKKAFVMTYRPSSKIEWSRPFVDTLMHGASYYGIFKGCIDIGNYEAERHYFPIKYRENIHKFPSENQISFAPETIRWPDYPSIQYLLGWKIDKTDKQFLSNHFNIIWEDKPLSIWKRRNR